jgi:hypothetical protein
MYNTELSYEEACEQMLAALREGLGISDDTIDALNSAVAEHRAGTITNSARRRKPATAAR